MQKMHTFLSAVSSGELMLSKMSHNDMNIMRKQRNNFGMASGNARSLLKARPSKISTRKRK